MERNKLQQIFHTIEEYQMIQPGMRVVAGISGGADSVCLLYVLCRYREIVPFELTAVHVEHGIRGAESLEDAAFTQELCRSLSVPCQVFHAAVQKTAQEQGISVEEAGRKERYRLFEEVCGNRDMDRIAVAHNQNDQAETVIWNLVRGSGAKGLGGIRPVRDRIIRPLLFTGRTQIEQILQEAGLTWKTDRTNLTEEYTRNKIRLSILPQMEQGLNAKAVEHIAEAADKLQKMQAFVERTTAKAAECCLQKDGESVVLDLEQYRNMDPLIQTELLKRALGLLKHGNGLKDIGSIHLEMLEQLIHADCGKESHLPGRICAVREKGILRLYMQSSTCRKKRADLPETAGYEILIPGEMNIHGWHIRTEILEYDAVLMPEIRSENQYTKWLNYDIIKSNVLLRTRKTGDYLVTTAQGGQKKLKDYFIDCKIPRQKRDEVLLLADDSHILWIVGGRISEAAKVNSATKQILKIQLEER